MKRARYAANSRSITSRVKPKVSIVYSCGGRCSRGFFATQARIAASASGVSVRPTAV
jgi:hypothetical protein